MIANGILDNFILFNTIINSIWYMFTIIFLLYKFTSFFTTAWGVMKFTGKLFYGIKSTCSKIILFFNSRNVKTQINDLESQPINPNIENINKNLYKNSPHINNDIQNTQDNNYGTWRIDSISSIYNKFFNGYKQFDKNDKTIPLETIYESKITDIDVNDFKKGTHSSDSQILAKVENSDLNESETYVNYKFNKNTKDKENILNSKLFKSVYPEGVYNKFPIYKESDSDILLHSKFINENLHNNKNENNNKNTNILNEQNKLYLKSINNTINLPFAQTR